MNIYPYVYRIDHPSGEFYIGSRCANRVPAESDFGRIYKTSTKHLSYPFEEYTRTILAEFYLPSGKDDAYDFEQLTIFESWGDPLLVNKRCHYGKVRWSTAGKTRSDEHRRKLSEANRGLPGKPHSDETKQKMSAARRRRITSDETKQKMSEAKRGKKRKPFSAEHRAKLSEAWGRRLNKKFDQGPDDPDAREEQHEQQGHQPVALVSAYCAVDQRNQAHQEKQRANSFHQCFSTWPHLPHRLRQMGSVECAPNALWIATCSGRCPSSQHQSLFITVCPFRR